MTHQELWLPVVGHEGAYEVSDLGRVRSLERVLTFKINHGSDPDKIAVRRIPAKVLKPNRSGPYSKVVLSNRHTRPVHVLVLQAFVGPRPDGLVSRHMDGNTENNRLDNLCYGTQLENYDDRRRHGTTLIGEANPNAILTAQQVREIRALAGTDTHKNIGRRYGVVESTIDKVLSGANWAHLDRRAA